MDLKSHHSVSHKLFESASVVSIRRKIANSHWRRFLARELIRKHLAPNIMAPIRQDGQEPVQRRKTLARREVADITYYLVRKVRRRTRRTWPPTAAICISLPCT